MTLNISRREYNGKIILPHPLFDTLTNFKDNGKDYATAITIDVNQITLPKLKQKYNFTKNGRVQVLDEDNNKDDIEMMEIDNPTPTPQVQTRSIVLKNKPLLRDEPQIEEEEEEEQEILGEFTINVAPPKINSPTTNNGFYKFNDQWNALTQGSSEDHDLIIQVPNATETLTATQNNQTYTPSQGNIGFRSVTVEVPQPSVESSKTVNITENTTTIITPSDNYDSIGELTITTAVPSNVNNQTLSTINSNGTYTPDSGYSGFNSFTVNVPQPSIQQNKTIVLNSNDTFTIRPDTNYDALDEITITTEVPTTDTVINNQNVNNNNLITSNGFYAPDSEHTGFNAFTVAIPLQKDKNINVNGKTGQTILWTPDAGYAGFEKTTITVIPPAYQTKTIRSNGTYTPDSNYDGFSSVTVEVPSSGTSTITKFGLWDYDTTIEKSSFQSVASNGTINVPLVNHENPETDELTKDFWILSYIKRNNKCWLCCSNFYTSNVSQNSSVNIINGSSQTVFYRVCSDINPFYDGSPISIYSGTNNLEFKTVSSTFEIDISDPNSEHSYPTCLYGTGDVDTPMDPTDPNFNVEPTFSLDRFNL